MINLYGNKAVEMCQGVRKATDRRSFAPCSGQDERRPGLLFEADGVLLTNEGNKAEGGRASSFCSSHQTLIARRLQPLTCYSVHLHNPKGKVGRQDYTIYRVGNGYLEIVPQSGRCKIRTCILINNPYPVW